MTEQERNKIIYQFAQKYLLDNAEGLTREILEEYFQNPRKDTLDDIFGMVLSSAVDWHKPKTKVLQYEFRKEKIRKLTGNGSVSYVVRTFGNKPDTLYEVFREKLLLDDKKFVIDTWRSYSNCICGMAKYLNKFGTSRNVYAYFDKFQSPEEKFALIDEVHNASRCDKTRSSGWGFALTANFLKDIGMMGYCKPDRYVMKVLTTLDICAKADAEAFRALSMIAYSVRKGDETATVFKLDRMLWLIGSGDFYKHPEIKWKGNLDDFIEKLKWKI